MARHNEVGRQGEDIACAELIKQGCAILERNWRSDRHEIDIIASRGNRLIIVEVKTRSNEDDDPLDAIDRRKMLKMVSAANAYIATLAEGHAMEIQFDIFAITGDSSGYRIEHIPDAFYPPLRTY